jgi:hypothetical protein
MEGDQMDEVEVIHEKKAKQSLLKNLRAKLESGDLASSQMSRSNSGQGISGQVPYLQTPASGPVVGAQEIKQEIKAEVKEEPMHDV